MSEEKKDGGDISSGRGETEVEGPVSDEKAEQMLHGDRDARQVKADEGYGTDEPQGGKTGGGGGGGGW